METEVLKFRKRANPFSQVSNAVIQNENLSLQGRGLYCLIQSYINCPNFEIKKNFIVKKSGLGRDAFQRYWNELKSVGLLIQYKLKDPKNGGRFYYEYELLDDIPETKTPDTSSSISGFSVSGKQGYLNNTNKNNNKLNNINNNKETIINEFFNKISTVDEQTNLLIVKLFNCLNENELNKIASIDKDTAQKLYTKTTEIINNNSIKSKEGYLRTLINSDLNTLTGSICQKYTEELINYEEEAKKVNTTITNEEIKAFELFRSENNHLQNQFIYL